MIYLTHKWDPNKYYQDLSGPGSYDSEGVIHNPQFSLYFPMKDLIQTVKTFLRGRVSVA